ncbi:hypothetical protein SYNTR_1007 [Candidatus Syntrophocurvum alkaliphilum]|uniref:General stress protein 17M-like domain-containing protein n=1 Tax=Candidatus Syntrophocurvum alkaliphilum TaxID=2293317 RepID=A0A6I6DGU4_9FIRM|nr:DUF1269 domain-containing protein [Candidatus Syntrophocurvum alkaliphilum]QGT99600.1 hypothetical protein SYNTR_1007 [Candidatus Syntrophocurvum alkaliphilum]
MERLIGYFEEHSSAEEAVKELRDGGFTENEISIIAREGEGGGGQEGGGYDDQNLTDGTLTGGAIGGIAGLALGAGALLIPGIGPILAAGPLGGVLAGAVTGGVAGGLIDYGIPEERSEHYESKVEEGKVLVVLETDENTAERAAETLKNYGAKDVEVH